ncbi:unnamed protein product, partial [Didymodactylos carnosus]
MDAVGLNENRTSFLQKQYSTQLQTGLYSPNFGYKAPASSIPVLSIDPKFDPSMPRRIVWSPEPIRTDSAFESASKISFLKSETWSEPKEIIPNLKGASNVSCSPNCKALLIGLTTALLIGAAGLAAVLVMWLKSDITTAVFT